jgi:signal transduction histidine kinase
MHGFDRSSQRSLAVAAPAAQHPRMRLVAAFVAAVAAIVAVTAVSLRSISARRDWSRWVTHTQDVRLALERVLAFSTDAETAQRGYLLTGREEYLRPFAGAEAQVEVQLDALVSLTRDNPPQQERVQKLRPLLQGKATSLAEAIALRRRNDPAAFANVASGEAGEVMQRVRGLVADMREEETRLLDERQRRLTRADRWSAWASAGGAALLLALAVGAALVVRDALRRREEQARERARILEYQERLIAIVGHDLRNPLTAVLVSAQMLLQKRADLTSGQATAVDRILRSASRIDALAALLIDFTYARLGKRIPTHPGPMDARAVAERAVDELRASNPGRTIRVESPAPALTGIWDGDRIAQVISNLVSNALHYGADAPVTVFLSDAGDQLEIRVHNEGKPIPPELRQHLFQAYQRGVGAESAHPRGFGLGLFIVREIARAHGGTVELHSEEQQGTHFVVRLPKRAPPPDPAEGAASPSGTRVPVA